MVGLKNKLIDFFAITVSISLALFQLVNQNWEGEMRDGYWLEQDYPGIYLGERQALNEDYTHSGYDRGHLNPNGHHAGMY